MAAIILKTVFLVMGIIMLVITVLSLAKRRMNESFCLAWGIISVSIIVAGCMLHPKEISEYISNLGLILILIIFFCVVYAAYFVSLKLSELEREKQELAINVSLLNEENMRILAKLSEITGTDIRDL